MKIKKLGIKEPHQEMTRSEGDRIYNAESVVFLTALREVAYADEVAVNITSENFFEGRIPFGGLLIAISGLLQGKKVSTI